MPTKVFLAAAALACTGVSAQGNLEIPAPNSIQTGIGVISGWHCTASRIEIRIDDLPPIVAGIRTDREDTIGACGRSDTGFSLLWNWNILPTQCFGCFFHRVAALADGVEFARTTVSVVNLGAEFLTGKSASYALMNFPQLGHVTTVQWDESKQNFSISGSYANAANPSQTYWGAFRPGPHNPACTPDSFTSPISARAVKHGTFAVRVADGRMSMSASFVDGSSCQLPEVALEAPTPNGGYFVARVIAKAVDAVLERVGFDHAVERGGIKSALAKSKYDASDLLAKDSRDVLLQIFRDINATVAAN